MEHELYKVVKSVSVSGLEQKVTELIREGWKPLGGIQTISFKSFPTEWAQAMVREQIAEAS